MAGLVAWDTGTLAEGMRWIRARVGAALTAAAARCPRSPSGSRPMIRKLKSGEYRIYSRKVDPKTGRRRNLGTFPSREAAQKHEREIQYFKKH
jgi:hypothetical protein